MVLRHVGTTRQCINTILYDYKSLGRGEMSHQFQSAVFYGNHTVTVRVESGNILIDSELASTTRTHDGKLLH